MTVATLMQQDGNAQPDTGQRGFTLIELMVSLAMGLVVLLGLMMVFANDAKVSTTLSSRTDRLSDLFLVSQIMQQELRNAQAGTISWSSNTLQYTNQDGNIGYFQYQRTSNDRLYWKQPPTTSIPSPSYEEVIRNLDTTNGMTVSGSANNIWTITLKSTYQDVDRSTQTVDLSFKVWARN